MFSSHVQQLTSVPDPGTEGQVDSSKSVEDASSTAEVTGVLTLCSGDLPQSSSLTTPVIEESSPSVS